MSEPSDFRLLFPDDAVLSLELLQQHGGLLEMKENMHVLSRSKRITSRTYYDTLDQESRKGMIVLETGV